MYWCIENQTPLSITTYTLHLHTPIIVTVSHKLFTQPVFFLKLCILNQFKRVVDAPGKRTLKIPSPWKNSLHAFLYIFQVPTFAKKKLKSPHCAMISVASEKVGFVLAIRLKREPNVVVKLYVCWIIYIFARFTYSLIYITKNGN